MKTLAIDFGEKRVGLAISDDKGVIAAPLDTLTRTNDEKIIEKIREIIQEKAIEQVLVGIPMTDRETPSAQESRNTKFAQKLLTQLQIPVLTWNEAFSTQSVLNKKKNVDAKAAAIFLQEFLDSIKN